MLILRTALLLGRSALGDLWSVRIAVAGLALLWRLKADAIRVILSGAGIGLVKLIVGG